MTREEFVDNYLASLGVVPFNKEDCTTLVVLEVIGSIYDLQEQVENLNERVNYLQSKGH